MTKLTPFGKVTIDKCLVCQGTILEPLLWAYSRYFPRLFHRVAICTNCGHIQHFPLLTRSQYDVINDRFFGSHYLHSGRLNQENNKRKLRKLDKTISAYLRTGWNILDVGAGEGWALEYFLEHNCNYFAIEPVAKLASSIRQRRGKVLGKSLTCSPNLKNKKFDLVVLRHNLEHLLDPRGTLIRLKELLTPNGLILLVVPNAENPSLHKGFRTSFIRPVHISYFCETNLLRLVWSVGLDTLVCNTTGEISLLLRSNRNAEQPDVSCYLEQKQIFLKKARKALLIDTVKILRSSIHA